MSSLSRRISLAALLTIPLVASPPARAADPLPTCIRYVDPVNGSDGAAGTLDYPWKTINRALYGTNPVSQGDAVVLLPGIYSPSTNGETMPIFLRHRVSLQGTNALNTILDGEGADVFRVFAVSATQDFANTLVDGVTITGGDRGVFMRTEELPIRVTFANCFIVKNRIGVQATLICDIREPIDGYRDHTFGLINDTIADNEIGILDEGIPAEDCDDSPPIVNGESSPCIANCLVYPNSCSDLQGVDNDDLVNTAFCTFDMAQITCPASYPPTTTSVIRGDRPSPSSIAIVCGIPRNAIYVLPARWDYRLKPPSFLVDLGTTSLVAANGTIGDTMFPCGLKVFDVDCEGYHNPRLVGGVPDVGADEQGQLLIAGFAPKTTDFNATHSTAFMLMTPRPTLSGNLSAETYVGGGPLGYTYNEPLSVPGARPKGTTVPTATPIGASVISASQLLPGFPMTFAMPAVGTPLSFTQASATAVRRNVQVLPRSDTPAQTTLSNLQSFQILP